jgi:hypothetical protein
MAKQDKQICWDIIKKEKKNYPETFEADFKREYGRVPTAKEFNEYQRFFTMKPMFKRGEHEELGGSDILQALE